MVLALILGVLALAGWGMAEWYGRELAEMQALIVRLEFQVYLGEGALRAAEAALRYRVRAAEAAPPLTEIPAAFRQAFGEVE